MTGANYLSFERLSSHNGWDVFGPIGTLNSANIQVEEGVCVFMWGGAGRGEVGGGGLKVTSCAQVDRIYCGVF